MNVIYKRREIKTLAHKPTEQRIAHTVWECFLSCCAKQTIEEAQMIVWRFRFEREWRVKRIQHHLSPKKISYCLPLLNQKHAYQHIGQSKNGWNVSFLEELGKMKCIIKTEQQIRLPEVQLSDAHRVTRN